MDERLWQPTACIDTLGKRALILRGVREYFDSRGFVEVQTPCLSRDVVVDRYIEPLSVNVRTSGSNEQFWLQTSPEFAMKRLLAAGASAIYQLGPVFRADEVGAIHNIEFTMLEWYRSGDDCQQGMQLLDDFTQSILGSAPAVYMTYQEAFRQFADVDPFQVRDLDRLNRLISERVEPGLASMSAVIIHDWPADQAALATIRRDEFGNHVAERFELYCHGIELANGYHELIDAEDLLLRNHQVNALRQQDDRPALPVHSRMMEAMRAGLPACCGVALGIDRLVMLALGKSSIREVMSFDISRA